MKDLKISFRKLDALQGVSLQNALRLHFDSVLLARARSYGSAFAVSVIASEEFGKAEGLAEIRFQASSDRSFRQHDHVFLKALLSDHKLKQGWFVSRFVGHWGPASVLKHYQTIQIDKNNSIYVGVRKGNHQIVRPFRVRASKAKKQISMVNDALLDVVEGVLSGKYEYDGVAQKFYARRMLYRKLLTVRHLLGGVAHIPVKRQTLETKI